MKTWKSILYKVDHYNYQLPFCWKCQLLYQKILYFCCIILKVQSYKLKKLQVGRWFLQHKRRILKFFCIIIYKILEIKWSREKTAIVLIVCFWLFLLFWNRIRWETPYGVNTYSSWIFYHMHCTKLLSPLIPWSANARNSPFPTTRDFYAYKTGIF